MQRAVVCLLLLGAANGVSLAATGPIDKVVTLLEDLKATLNGDAVSEQKAYDKFACWCEKASEAKAKAIDSGKEDVRRLAQEILTCKGKIQTLIKQAGKLELRIKNSEQLIADGRVARKKEVDAFDEETADMKQALSLLERAITVIGKDGGAGLLQVRTSAASSLAVVKILETLPMHTNVPLSHLSALSQFSSRAAGAPQSSTIQGILKEMYSQFAQDLQSSSRSDADASTEHESLVISTTQTINDAKDELQITMQKKADEESQLALATENYDQSSVLRNQDIEFFDQTKTSCQKKANEHTKRVSLRTSELEGVDKALEILTAEDSRKLFEQAIKPGFENSFLQISIQKAMTAETHAWSVLNAAATEAHSPRLAALATRIRGFGAHFDKVLAQIDGMIVTLKEEADADKIKRDDCRETRQTLKLAISKWSHEIKKNKGQINRLETLIGELTDEKELTIETKRQAISDLSTATDERTGAHTAFLQAQSDDEGAIALLKNATAALSAYYQTHSTSLIQADPEFEKDEFHAPEAKHSDKLNRQGKADGIVAILETLITDLEDEVSTGKFQEAEGVTDYQAAKEALEKQIEELEQKKIRLAGAIAVNNGKLGDTKIELGDNEVNLQGEEKSLSDIKVDCDWVMSTFGKRAKQRADEMNGLKAAKEYLNGISK